MLDEILSNPVSWVIFGLIMSIVTTIIHYIKPPKH
jgi:hypothetical protein